MPRRAMIPFMHPVPHPLLRAVCSLALVLGLGLSGLEEMGCDSAQQGITIQASTLPTGGSTAHSGGPLADAPGVSHCCPCIHTYPAGFVVRLAPALMVEGHLARFANSSRLVPTSRAEPLVPPPIA